MKRDEVGIRGFGEGEGVEEEKAEDDKNRNQNTPPQLAVHHSLDSLFAFVEIFHSCVERVEGPDIECCQCAS